MRYSNACRNSSAYVGCLLVTLALLAPVGCAGFSSTKQPTKSTSGPAPLADWRTIIGKPELESQATIGGRRLAVYSGSFSGVTKSGQYVSPDGGKLIVHKGTQPFYELRDVTSGKVLLPMDNHRIEFIGETVCVLPPKGRMAEETALNAQMLFYLRLNGNRTRPNAIRPVAPATHWQQFDPATGARSSTDIAMVWRSFADRKDDPTLPAELRQPALLVVRLKPDEKDYEGTAIGRLDAETYSPTGQRLGLFPHFAPQGQVGHFQMTRENIYSPVQGGKRYSILSTFNSDGSTTSHLLGRVLEPVDASQTLLVECVADHLNRTNDYATSVIARRKPTENHQDDYLFDILQSDGTFALPPGVKGLIPIRDADGVNINRRTEISYWMVRYATPDEPGYDATVNPARPGKSPLAWGYCSANLSGFSGPLWEGWQPAKPFLVSQKEKNHNQRAGYHRALDGFVARLDGQFIGYEATEAWQNERLITTVKQWATSTTSADQATRIMEFAIQQDFNQKQQQLIANMNKAVRDLQVGAFNEGMATGDRAKMGLFIHQLGGDYWYDYVLATDAGSSVALSEAAEKVATPAKAADLRRRAEQARVNEIAESNRRAAEAKAAQARAKEASLNYQRQAASGSGYSTYAAPSQSYSIPAPAPVSAQQQRYLYETQLNKQIYGTAWDPYK